MFDVGTLLENRYEILSTLGSGNSAIVFEANDNLLSKHVAIKVFINHNLSKKDDESINELVDTLLSFSHPNIPSVYNIFKHKNKLCIAMEILVGKDLHNLLTDENTKFDSQKIKNIARQVFNLYLFGRSKNMYWRYEPSNLFVCENGTVKILGTPFHLQDNGDMLLTGTHIDAELDYSDPSVNGLTKTNYDLYTQYLLGKVFLAALTKFNREVSFMGILTWRGRLINALKKGSNKLPAQRYRSLLDFLVALSGRRLADKYPILGLFETPLRALTTLVAASLISVFVSYSYPMARFVFTALVADESLEAQIKNERDYIIGQIEHGTKILSNPFFEMLNLEQQAVIGTYENLQMRLQNVSSNVDRLFAEAIDSSNINILYELTNTSQLISKEVNWLELAPTYLEQLNRRDEARFSLNEVLAPHRIVSIELFNEIEEQDRRITNALENRNISNAVGLLSSQSELMLSFARETLSILELKDSAVKKLDEESVPKGEYKEPLERAELLLRAGRFQEARSIYSQLLLR